MTVLNARKVLRTSLVLTLSLSISGALPVIGPVIGGISSVGVGTASAAGAAVDLRAVSTMGTELEERIKLQIRRARQPDAPGTPAGLPTASEVTALERDLLAWREQIETVLALPSLPSKSAPGSQYLAAESKLRAINLYLNQLTALTTLKIALNQTHGPQWSDGFALRVPPSVMSDFPGLGSPARNRLGDHFLPLVIDRGKNDGRDGPAGPVLLKLSASLVQGLELGRLADRPDNQTYFTMVQYMAVRQLLQNLSDLRYLKQDRSVRLPEIPQPLRGKLESMNLVAMIDEEQRRAVAEPGARAALISTFHGAAAAFPAFTTPKLVSDLVDATRPAPSAREEAVTSFTEALTAAEAQATESAVEEEISASSLPLSALQGAEMTSTLRAFVASGKAGALLERIMDLIANGILPDLDSDQRQRVMDALDARKAAYGASVSEASLAAWQRSARRASEAELFDSRRSQFIESLLVHAPQVVRDVQRTYDGDAIDVGVLLRSFSAERAQLGPRPSVDEWAFTIAQAGSYSAARDAYRKLMTLLTGQAVVESQAGPLVAPLERIDPAAVRRFVETHDFRPQIQFSPGVSPAQAERVVARLIEGRKKDIRDLLAVGEWLGFHSEHPAREPSVQAVLAEPAKLERYFRALDESVISQNPILATEITVSTPTQRDASARLADALAALNPRHQSDAETMRRAEPLVDQALLKSETKILEDIQTVARATELKDIEAVVTSSLMMALVMRGFPEFGIQRDELVQRMLSPSLTDQIMRRYVGNYIIWGGLALMAMHGANWMAKKLVKRAFPFTDVMTAGFDSLAAGYMRSLMLMIVADTAYQAAEFHHIGKQHSQTEDFFAAGASGRSFFEYGEFRQANSGYEFAKWSFYGRIAADALFMYLPMARHVLTAHGDRVALGRLAENSADLAKLGLGPDDFGRAEVMMGLARQVRSAASKVSVIDFTPGTPSEAVGARMADFLKRARDMNAADFAEIEAAAGRIAGVVRAGKTYRLPNTFREMAIQDAFKALGLGGWLNKLRPAAAWDKIDDALAQMTHAGRSAAQATRTRRAAEFLKRILEETPAIRETRFADVSRAERRLAAAYGRTRAIEAYWENYARLAAREAKLEDVRIPNARPANDNGASPLDPAGKDGK